MTITRKHAVIQIYPLYIFSFCNGNTCNEIELKTRWRKDERGEGNGKTAVKKHQLRELLRCKKKEMPIEPKGRQQHPIAHLHFSFPLVIYKHLVHFLFFFWHLVKLLFPPIPVSQFHQSKTPSGLAAAVALVGLEAAIYLLLDHSLSIEGDAHYVSLRKRILVLLRRGNI